MNSSCFSLWSWKDLEPLMVKLPLQSDSISKMRMNNTTGFDLCKDYTEFLNQIGVTNIHEKNIHLLNNRYMMLKKTTRCHKIQILFSHPRHHKYLSICNVGINHSKFYEEKGLS